MKKAIYTVMLALALPVVIVIAMGAVVFGVLVGAGKAATQIWGE